MVAVIRDFETFTGTSTALVGATVRARAASNTHPNADAVVASTTTNSNGMWEFTALADGVYDIEIEYNGRKRYRKGNSAFSNSLGLSVLPNLIQVGVADGSSSNPTTTSTSFADVPIDAVPNPLQVTMTTNGGELIALLAMSIDNNTLGATNQVRLVLDGANARGQVAVETKVANYSDCIVAIGRWTGVSAASHTVKAQWMTSAGTMRSLSTFRHMIVAELRKVGA